MGTWFAERAWLPAGLADAVTIEADGSTITAVTPDSRRPRRARRLPGLVLPGFANTHSHAFHRALRGRVEQQAGTFWSWREAMYRLAARLDPERYYQLARATYAEMALAGFTAVGEFHYLHHQPDGRAYDSPNAMQDALAQAAADAGLRITLLDACYLRGGFDSPLQGAQHRFSDGDADAWAERTSARARADHVRHGGAVHSVRAVDPGAISVVRAWAQAHDAPLHVHLSEQPAENDACRRHTGRTPTALLDELDVLGPSTTAVHATHLTGDDIAALGRTGTAVCVCPTTERALADGVGPTAQLHAAGTPLSVGTDSHAVIDAFAEARALELDQRLVRLRRGHFDAATLLHAATRAGMASLGWPAGAIAPGYLCDLVAVDTDTVRFAGLTDAAAVEFMVFAGTACDITDVVSSDTHVVAGGQHQTVPRVAENLHRAIGQLVDS